MHIHRNQQQKRLWAISSAISLGLVLGACGQDSEADLENLSSELGQLEQAFRHGGDRKARPCRSYASICEQAASICLWIDEGPLAARCGAIAKRCERNLLQHCSRPSPWQTTDAGPAPDSGSCTASSYYDACGGEEQCPDDLSASGTSCALEGQICKYRPPGCPEGRQSKMTCTNMIWRWDGLHCDPVEP